MRMESEVMFFCPPYGADYGLIFTFRNQTVASPCLPCSPMRPLVGNSAKGVLSHFGIWEPSGFFLADVHFAMSYRR